MSTSPLFLNAGAKPGLVGWRIEDFTPIPIEINPTKESLKLHTGDSYIILHSTPVRPQSTILNHDIYYWLGSESTTDEKGTAAVLTVELDDSLGGLPVQRREVQFYETPKFLALFPKGVEYLEGGVESGFRAVSREPELRLYQVKANMADRAEPLIVSIPPRCRHMNHGDTFVLVTKDNAYIWNGAKAALREKTAGSQFASKLNKVRTVVCTGNDSDFFSHLEGEYTEVAPADDASKDEAFFKEQTPKYYVYGSDAKSINEKDVILCDAGNHLYIYIGEDTTPEQRKAAVKAFQPLIDQEDPSCRVISIRKQTTGDASWEHCLRAARPDHFHRVD